MLYNIAIIKVLNCNTMNGVVSCTTGMPLLYQKIPSFHYLS
jgi:hypothetical protein